MASWVALNLRRAIEDGRFVPHFQPKVNLRTSRLVGFEALARWKYPPREFVSPEEFIPLIEEAGLATKFTERMLQTVFAAARDLVPEPLFVSVNISPVQMLEGNLAELICRVADQEAFSLHRLVVEVTENAFVDNLKIAYACAKSLKDLGVRLALDDFGTGYSNLYHLQALPFDEIKIGMSFVRSMLRQRESRKIIAAVVGLGHSLDLVTVAEGIEDIAQAAMLVRMGCDRGQGWLYGKPVPAEKLAKLIAAWEPPPSFRHSEAHETAELCPYLEAQPALRLAQLRAIYDGAPVGLCFVDSKLRFVTINERLAATNHCSVAEHLGQSVSEINPELFVQIEPFLQLALRGEASHDLEIRASGAPPDFSERTLLATCQPVRDEAGEVVGVSIAMIDITARRAAEQALRDSETPLQLLRKDF
jgi:PAS domain S-box-containing protein